MTKCNCYIGPTHHSFNYSTGLLNQKYLFCVFVQGPRKEGEDIYKKSTQTSVPQTDALVKHQKPKEGNSAEVNCQSYCII